MKKLLDFDLEIALKEPERVVFADGTKVEDWNYFKGASLSVYKLTVLRNGMIYLFTAKGEAVDGCVSAQLDLKLLPKTKTRHFCVYQQGRYPAWISSFYETVEEMRNNIEGENLTILQEYTYTEELP